MNDGERHRDVNRANNDMSKPSGQLAANKQITSTHANNFLDKRLVSADFSLLEWRDGRPNPCDEGKLLPPTHLIPSLKTNIGVHSLVI